MHQVHSIIYERPLAIFWTVAIQACQIGWIIGLCLEVKVANASALGWTFFFFKICFITIARVNARDAWNVYGFLPEDFFSSLVMYPFVVSQLSLQASYVPLPVPSAPEPEPAKAVEEPFYDPDVIDMS